MNEPIRVWKEIEVEDLSKHLLIVGLLTGDCASCKELGIDYASAKTCPACGVTFKYIASRSKEVRKILHKRPDLIFIDFEDYKKATGSLKARNLFGS